MGLHSRLPVRYRTVTCRGCGNTVRRHSRHVPQQTPAGTLHHENIKTAGIAPEIRTLNLPNTKQLGQPTTQKAQENIFMADHSPFLYFYEYLFSNSTATRRLTTRIRSVKCVVRAISSLCERHTVYLHRPRQYSIAYCTPTLYGIAYCC